MAPGGSIQNSTEWSEWLDERKYAVYNGRAYITTITIVLIFPKITKGCSIIFGSYYHSIGSCLFSEYRY